MITVLSDTMCGFTSKINRDVVELTDQRLSYLSPGYTLYVHAVKSPILLFYRKTYLHCIWHACGLRRLQIQIQSTFLLIIYVKQEKVKT